MTLAALRLLPHVFVRPGELRHAEWGEFDLENAVWTIPDVKTKMRREHRVPLSRQAPTIIASIETDARLSPLVFPSLRSVKRPMSETTINAALRRLGYAQDEMTAHGFPCDGEHIAQRNGEVESRRYRTATRPRGWQQGSSGLHARRLLG